MNGFLFGVQHEDFHLEDYRHLPAEGKEDGAAKRRGSQRQPLQGLGNGIQGDGPLSAHLSDNERPPLPVHPADHFTMQDLCDFAGWFPYEWWRDEAKFETWLLEAFGPKIEYDGRKTQRFSLYAALEVITRMNAAKSLPFANEDSIQGLV